MFTTIEDAVVPSNYDAYLDPQTGDGKERKAHAGASSFAGRHVHLIDADHIEQSSLSIKQSELKAENGEEAHRQSRTGSPAFTDGHRELEDKYADWLTRKKEIEEQVEATLAMAGRKLGKYGAAGGRDDHARGPEGDALSADHTKTRAAISGVDGAHRDALRTLLEVKVRERAALSQGGTTPALFKEEAKLVAQHVATLTKTQAGQASDLETKKGQLGWELVTSLGAPANKAAVGKLFAFQQAVFEGANNSYLGSAIRYPSPEGHQQDAAIEGSLHTVLSVLAKLEQGKARGIYDEAVKKGGAGYALLSAAGARQKFASQADGGDLIADPYLLRTIRGVLLELGKCGGLEQRDIESQLNGIQQVSASKAAGGEEKTVRTWLDRESGCRGLYAKFRQGCQAASLALKDIAVLEEAKRYIKSREPGLPDMNGADLRLVEMRPRLVSQRNEINAENIQEKIQDAVTSTEKASRKKQAIEGPKEQLDCLLAKGGGDDAKAVWFEKGRPDLASRNIFARLAHWWNARRERQELRQWLHGVLRLEFGTKAAEAALTANCPAGKEITLGRIRAASAFAKTQFEDARVNDAMQRYTNEWFAKRTNGVFTDEQIAKFRTDIEGLIRSGSGDLRILERGLFNKEGVLPDKEIIEAARSFDHSSDIPDEANQRAEADAGVSIVEAAKSRLTRVLGWGAEQKDAATQMDSWKREMNKLAHGDKPEQEAASVPTAAASSEAEVTSEWVFPEHEPSVAPLTEVEESNSTNIVEAAKSLLTRVLGWGAEQKDAATQMDSWKREMNKLAHGDKAEQRAASVPTAAASSEAEVTSDWVFPEHEPSAAPLTEVEESNSTNSASDDEIVDQNEASAAPLEVEESVAKSDAPATARQGWMSWFLSGWGR